MKFSAELFEKYDKPGPRYTSYPTAPSWHDDFGPDGHRTSLEEASQDRGSGLSLYVHIPFCERLCVYCGCATVITRRLERGGPYVDRVLREAQMVRDVLGEDRPVLQHHWGGGTPTFLEPEDLGRLAEGLMALFPLGPGAEVSIEVDPRVTTPAQLEVLRRCGFNRVSMGVQDFDPRVQEAINRVQSFEQTRDLVLAARDLGYESVNLDLVYGLPHQEQASFERSIEKTLELQPDRVACYGYAHVPWLRKHQLAIPQDTLPSGREKLQLYLAALQAFVSLGYEPIGMDHFAKREDGLFAAADDGSLHRNFQGYTTHAAEDLVGFGVTAISEVAGAFAQNAKALKDWEASVDAGRIPTVRGLRRSAEDEARRAVILDLMCRFRLRFADHGGGDAFRAKYGDALEVLAPMQADGLLSIDHEGIAVSELGRMFVRNICMPFDAYLGRKAPEKPMYSRTV